VHTVSLTGEDGAKEMMFGGSSCSIVNDVDASLRGRHEITISTTTY